MTPVSKSNYVLNEEPLPNAAGYMLVTMPDRHTRQGGKLLIAWTLDSVGVVAAYQTTRKRYMHWCLTPTIQCDFLHRSIGVRCERSSSSAKIGSDKNQQCRIRNGPDDANVPSDATPVACLANRPGAPRQPYPHLLI